VQQAEGAGFDRDTVIAVLSDLIDSAPFNQTEPVSSRPPAPLSRDFGCGLRTPDVARCRSISNHRAHRASASVSPALAALQNVW
jgi:hypothetical protein